MQTNINVGQGARRTNHPRFSPRPLREVLAGRATSLFYPSPLAGEGRVRGNKKRGITEQGNNFIIYPLIGFECLRTQNHFPRQGGSQTASGFTLIELLVVVLIIGILAAVALPQYQKVVERSKATQAITLLKSVYNAAKAYQLANGSWPASFDELAVDIPWTGTTNAINLGHHQQGKSNADWSIQMRNSGTMSNVRGVTIGRISGPYKGAQFYMYAVPQHPQYSADELLCVEIKNPTDAVSPFSKTTGTYCEKIMKATHINTASNGAWDYFRMP